MNVSEQFVDSEQRFRSLFENNLDLLLFQNEKSIILDANTPFLSLLHREKSEVIGHSIDDFLPEDLVVFFRQKLYEAFQGKPVQFDVAVQFKGAEPKVLSIAKVPLVIDGAVVGVHMVGRDITELTASNQLIEEQAHKLNILFESITDALILLDREWNITFLNQEAQHLLKVKSQQAVGRNVWEMFPAEVGSVFYQEYHEAMATGQVVHFEAYYTTGGLWLEVKGFPSEEGLSVYFSDITTRRDAEARQERLTQDLYRHNQDLQQFTYIVSHNLRAPLANALGLTQLLKVDDPEQAPLLDHLHTSLHQLDSILQDLNTILSVRDRQGVVESSEAVLVLDVLRQVTNSLQESLQQCGGEIVLNVPDDLQVHGKRAYLFSIFFNLLSNSIKYRAEERPLWVTITGNSNPNGEVRLTIMDNGSGFDREKAGEDVFKFYKRFHSVPAGRGLGLYLVNAHVEAMGGRIEVHSMPDAGTEFQLLLH
ncbi:PAS domain-containing sensor histidine kinase [Hymenobacter volaticus]|uniref:histidine kinase n=1 Tax=Hymenobacter volaticus TaxID=2932254 RepID=A0ABY4G0C6_9BACT|nr:PAS domain-containing protein [Hymenobacter volaticus]UOQ64288.1 PAS domain-containing protein [Hymenobacter volaticus]